MRRKNPRQKVAVFIDVANLREADMKWLIRTARRQGQIEIAYGYASFTSRQDLGRAALKLFSLGIRLIHCPSWKNGSKELKNAADELMMVDIQHTLMSRPDISRYVICSGDGHFVPVVSQIRTSGKDVIIITPADGASYLLKAAASWHLTAPNYPCSPRVDDSRPETSDGSNTRRILNPPPLRKPGLAA